MKYAPSSLARNAKSDAISSGRAWRPIGIFAFVASSISGVYSASCIGVIT